LRPPGVISLFPICCEIGFGGYGELHRLSKFPFSVSPEMRTGNGITQVCAPPETPRRFAPRNGKIR